MTSSSKTNPFTKMHLFGLFVLFLWNSRSEGVVNINYQSEGKILGAAHNYVYQLFYDKKNFTDAEDECDDQRGHLITIADQATMDKIAEGLFEHDILEEGSARFFWFGLQWNDSWLFTAGNPQNWTVFKYANWDQVPTPDENEDHCVGLKFYNHKKFKWHTEKCEVEAPYICQILDKKCLPWVETGRGQMIHMDKSKSNYGCPGYEISMRYIVNECECNKTEITIEYDNEKSCDDKHRDYFWHDKVCVPGCHPTKINPPFGTTLMNPSRDYFAGSRVDYYCPGYFEYDGEIHPHNIFQMPCRKMESFPEMLTKLKCFPEDPDDVNKDIQQLDAVVGHSYHLKCEYDGPPNFKPNQFFWYRNGQRVSPDAHIKVFDKNFNWTLHIENLAEDNCGIYMCVASFSDTKHKLLYGSVYNVSVDQFLKAQAALLNRNDVIEKFAGYYMNEAGTYSSLIAFSHELNWAEAHEWCEHETTGGHVAKMNGTKAFPLVRNFFSAAALENTPSLSQDSEKHPKFYWVGDRVSSTTGKITDGFSAGTGPTLQVDDSKMKVTPGDSQCVAVRLSWRGDVELIRANCNNRAPFICSVHAQPCLPPGTTIGAQAQRDNFLCDWAHNDTLEEVASATSCECYPSNDTFDRRQIDGHKSCNYDSTWTTTLCLPWCHAAPFHDKLGKLVPTVYRPDYYKGMVMTYFCAGHYEVGGAQYPQSSIEVVCNPGNGDNDMDLDIQCKPESAAMEDDSLDTIYIEADMKKTILLECNFIDKVAQPTRYVWMHNKEALSPRSPNEPFYPHYSVELDTGSLKIQQPDMTSAGVYMCFGDYNGLLAPGNVHKLQSKDSSEDDVEPTEIDSSGTNSVPFHLSLLVFCTAMLCLMLPFLHFGVLLC